MTQKFSAWLASELKKRGLGVSEFSRLAGTYPATISNVLTGHRQPGDDLCRGIARALGLPQWEVFMKAGLLTEPPREMTTRDYQIERLADRLMALPEAERKRLLALAEGMVDLVEKKAGA